MFRDVLLSGCLLLVTSLLMPVGAAAAAKTAEQLLAEGDAAHRLGHHKRAVKAYEGALKELERPYGALMGLARAHVALDRFDEARVFVDRALEVAAEGDERAAALNYRGMTFARESQWLSAGRRHRKSHGQRYELLLQAIESYREALGAIEHPPAAIWANLADAQSQALQREAARASAEKFLELEPSARASVAGLLAHLDCLDQMATAIDFKGALERWGKDEMEPPRKVHYPSPEPVSRSSSGIGYFELIIDREGSPHCARLTANHGLEPAFVAGALRTLSTWRFEPARLRGEPVSVIYAMTITVR